MSFQDDELDNELRRLFTDERLDLPARPDAEQAVLAGAKRIRRRRALLAGGGGAAAVVAVLFAGVALTANGPAEKLPPVGMGPQTSAPTTERSVPKTSARTSAPVSTPSSEPVVPSVRPPTDNPGNAPARPPEPVPEPVLAGTPLGPAGFGKLVLGMTSEQAIATGSLEDGAVPPADCKQYAVRGDSGSRAMLGAGTGLEAITAGPAVTTPKGIGAGATRDQVRAAYPDATVAGGDLRVTVPGNASAEYQFRFRGSDPDVLSHLVMALHTRECVS